MNRISPKHINKKPRTRACDVCHLRKVKCGKEIPHCSNCIKHKVPCTYLIAKGEAPTRKNDRKIIKSDLFSQNLLETNIIVYNNQEQYRLMDSMKVDKINKISSLDALTDAFRKLKVEDEFNSIYINTQGESLYLGNSPMGFYVSNKNAINKQNYSNIGKNEKKHKPKYTPTDNSNSLMSFGNQVTSELIAKLIDLYFQQVNGYQMLINKQSFFKNFNNPKKLLQNDFLALLNAVCLSGAGHFQHKIVAPMLGNLFQYKTEYYIKKCYLKPTLYTVQTLTLVCQYIGTHPNDIYSKKGWFYMLMAQRHATLLGLNLPNNHLSPHDSEIRKRIWWTIFIDDRIFSLCVGRQRTVNGFCTKLKLPKFNKKIDSIQFDFESGINFPISEPSMEILFFSSYIKYCRLLGKLLKAQTGFKKSPTPDSIQKILTIEKMLHIWYIQLPNNLHINKRIDWITLPYEKDSYSSIIHIYYLSILVELNRPLIEPNEEINYIFVESIGSNGVKVSDFSLQNASTKCSIATKLGSQIIVNMGLSFVIQSPAYKWWCLMNFVFILSNNLEVAKQNHPIFSSVMKNLLFGLNNLSLEGGQRWPMVKQISIMVTNLLEASS